MTILQVITCSNLGGAQSVVACLANALCEEHRVIVVAGEGDGKIWPMIDSKVEKVHCPTLKRAISPLNELRTLLFLKRMFFRYHPDVIHLHSSKAGLLGRLAFPKSKIVYTVHGFDSIRLAFRKLLPLEKLMQYRCRYIVGVSHYDERNLRAEGINHNVSVVYNGIVESAACCIDRTRWRFPDKYHKVVLCIARFSPPKKSDLFLQVAAALPLYAFVWIGNQYEVTESHTENVFFLGNLPEASSYCKFADLFMLPSNYEGLPMVIIEAMRSGLPIVASDVGGVSEIVHNNENGYALANDPKLFASKIRYIMENDEVRQRMAENSKKRFILDLTARDMVRGYLKLYNQISQQS